MPWPAPPSPPPPSSPSPSAGGGGSSAQHGPELRFHRGHADVARPAASAISAGFIHSAALSRTGAVLVWRSSDPQLRVQEVLGALAGERAPEGEGGYGWGARGLGRGAGLIPQPSSRCPGP